MEKQKTCIHCGADCGKYPVIWHDKNFCCEGCKQVYQLLNDNKLYNYYDLESAPGIKTEADQYASKYAYLDKNEVQEKLFDFREGAQAKVTFYIPGIHCASCIWLLEHLNKLNSGILHSAVNFVKKELTVNFNTNIISLRKLVELLVSIHYIPDISLKSLDKKDVKSVDKKLLYKIGVAGFIFGNVMLYSLPEYFNGKPLEGSLGVFLDYISFALAVPLVFYSGSDYIVSAYKNIRKGIVNIDLPIALGILTLFFVTCFEILTQTGQGYSDSLSGFLFFLLIGRWYQSKTYQSLSFDRDYKSYFPIAATKISNNTEVSCLIDEISPNDILLIRSKELVPADSKLIDGTALIDYSFVSGESTPIKKEKGDFIYAGGIQTSGAIKVQVEKHVKQSHLTQLWNQSEINNSTKKLLRPLIDKISIYFTLAIVSIALMSFAYWIWADKFESAVLVFTSVLIVACPCALALSLPFTLGNAMRILGKLGLYLKNTSVIEKLAQINALVFDKTGTITQPDSSNIVYYGKELPEPELQAIVSLCSQSVHPLSYALTRYYNNIPLLPVSQYTEISGRGVYGQVGNYHVRIGSAEYTNCPLQDRLHQSAIYININNSCKGHFNINNKYRDGVDNVLSNLKRKWQLYLLSGDNDSERNTLENYFPAQNLHFNQQPIDKKNFINDLQKKGFSVLMTGDGLNDAGAFMQCDVALSVADDIYHFSPAGDAIIEASKFYKLDRFITYAHSSIRIVKASFIISFLYNVIGLTFAISGNLSPVVAAILMPVSSVSVVAFATLATRIAARKLK